MWQKIENKERISKREKAYFGNRFVYEQFECAMSMWIWSVINKMERENTCLLDALLLNE